MGGFDLFHAPSRRRRPTPSAGPLACVIALVLLAQGAVASHWTLQNAVDPDVVHRTYEDDAAHVSATGNAFDGIGNRVVPPGRTPGDGSLFLDALLGNIVGSGDSTSFTMSSGAIMEPVTGDRSVLLPGLLRASAWYGQWNDFNGDGRIDDQHDVIDSPEDEFKWRGVGSGHPVAMPFYSIPSTRAEISVPPTGASVATGVVAAGDRAGYADHGLLKDRTAHSEGEQEWVQSGFIHWMDAPFLTQVQLVVVAGAPSRIGGEPAYDIHHADALVDVDTYHSVSPDVEALWVSAVREGVRAYEGRPGVPGTPVPPEAPDIPEPVDIGELLSDPVRIIIDEAAPWLAEAAATIAALTPWDVKEPNHAEDDYGGRAVFGGVGDVRGSGNAYDGYVDGYHYFFDAYPRTRTCLGAWAGVPTTSIEVRSTIFCSTPGGTLEPVAGRFSGTRSTGTLMTLEAVSHLWNDKNLDTYHGSACTPGTASFDSANNTCSASSAPRTHGYNSDAEAIGICPTTTARDGILTISPVGGEWGGVILLTDYVDLARGAVEGTARVLLGQEAVQIRFAVECIGTGHIVVARDALVFPNGGPSVTLRSEMTASSTGYVDHEVGISVGAETVTDVDYLLPVM